MKHQILRPFNQSENGGSDTLGLRDQILVSNSGFGGGGSSVSPSNGEYDYQTSVKQKPRRFGAGSQSNPNYTHEYSTGSLPQIDEVSSPIPTGNVSKLQMATSTTPVQQQKLVQTSQKYPISNTNTTYGSIIEDQSYLMGASGSYNKPNQPGKFNIFPANKLATAIAWHEESIREENEYAENDEGNMFTNNNSDSQRSLIMRGMQAKGEFGSNGYVNETKGSKIRSSQEQQNNFGLKQQNPSNPYNNFSAQPTTIVVMSSGQNFNGKNQGVNSNMGARGIPKSFNTLVENHQPGGLQANHLNRNMIINSQSNVVAPKIQQRYASQVKEKSYNQAAPVNTNEYQGANVVVGQSNQDKLQQLHKMRGRIQEVESKYQQDQTRETNNIRAQVNKSELLPSNLQQHNMKVSSHYQLNEFDGKAGNKQINTASVGLKGGINAGAGAKIKAKRAQDANKILKAYNMEQDIQLQVQGNHQENAKELSKHRKKYQASSIKRKDGDQYQQISGDITPQINIIRRDPTDTNQNVQTTSSSRTRQQYNLQLKKSSNNGSKAILNLPSQTATFTKTRVSEVNDMCESQTDAQFELIHLGKDSSQRLSRQGKYQKSPIPPPQQENLSHGRGAAKIFNYGGGQPGKLGLQVQNKNHLKDPSTTGQAFGQRKVSHPLQQPQIYAPTEEQLKLLQRLNHDYTYQLGNGELLSGRDGHKHDADDPQRQVSGHESVTSYIEENIERESEVRSEFQQSRKSTRRRGTKGQRQRTGGKRSNKLESDQEQEEDEYDVDYDNLVVSDILGTSGLPPGLPTFAGNVGGAKNCGPNFGTKQASFSLYDFT